jgi:hypothetical protein
MNLIPVILYYGWSERRKAKGEGLKVKGESVLNGERLKVKGQDKKTFYRSAFTFYQEVYQFHVNFPVLKKTYYLSFFSF